METTICSNQGFFTFYFLQIKEKAAIAIHANGYKASTAMDNHLSTHFQNQAVKKLRQKKKTLWLQRRIHFSWNQLPMELRKRKSMYTFKSKLDRLLPNLIDSLQ